MFMWEGVWRALAFPGFMFGRGAGALFRVEGVLLLLFLVLSKPKTPNPITTTVDG